MFNDVVAQLSNIDEMEAFEKNYSGPQKTTRNMIIIKSS